MTRRISLQREREGEMTAISNSEWVSHLLKVPSGGCWIEERQLEFFIGTNDKHLKILCQNIKQEGNMD